MAAYTGTAMCGNACVWASDGDCDDGGAGSEYDSLCNYGQDCVDCGPRVPMPPSAPASPGYPPMPPGILCQNHCVYASDGDCDDGGPGAEFSLCAYGSDCQDCGLLKLTPCAAAEYALRYIAINVTLSVRCLPAHPTSAPNPLAITLGGISYAINGRRLSEADEPGKEDVVVVVDMTQPGVPSAHSRDLDALIRNGTDLSRAVDEQLRGMPMPHGQCPHARGINSSSMHEALTITTTVLDLDGSLDDLSQDMLTGMLTQASEQAVGSSTLVATGAALSNGGTDGGSTAGGDGADADGTATEADTTPAPISAAHIEPLHLGAIVAVGIVALLGACSAVAVGITCRNRSIARRESIASKLGYDESSRGTEMERTTGSRLTDGMRMGGVKRAEKSKRRLREDALKGKTQLFGERQTFGDGPVVV